ncbi:DNA polymerase III subunit delta [Thermincola ferriacetica]|uniref:DNA polymerase III subunit delta n=1 Tax=Thermincola ferriacetica TaxID=281456 RepID=A0A0L6VZY5_9FIRM|nr:DNA polymerase III subunit delta [Thermincola ferriacetica]KNZ68835.1 DNA polymerase III subunit delta [Thermincola ferriacetica]
MSYQALMNSLKRKVVLPVYLFWGEETFLLEEVLAKFKYQLIPPDVRDFNMDVVEGKNVSPEDIVRLATTLPFMSDKRVVIIENADLFKAQKKTGEKSDQAKSQEELLIEYCKQPLDTTCLIFTSDSVDRKKKLFKAVQETGMAVEFTPLKDTELNDWVENRINGMGKNIETEAVDELVAAVGSNLRMLDAELRKLFNYTGERKVINREDVLQLVSKTTNLSIFELVDAVGERNSQKAIQLMREMIIYGEPPVRLLFMVAKHFRTLLQAKTLYLTGYAEKQVATQLQIHPYVARKCVRQSKNFSREELEQALEKILETDISIKTSYREPVLALELLFVNLCRQERAI